MRSFTLAALLLLISNTNAFEFGSLMHSAAPVAQSVAPIKYLMDR